MAFDLARARAIGLSAEEIAVFRRLSSPHKIQNFVSAMPVNFEPDGDTCHSVRTALRKNVCHCIEGAFIAACALMLHGERALLLDFQAEGDDDHVVALFKRDGHWGAVSKSNSIWLRWRDPVYRTTRELAMSYFHEYIRREKKSLRRVSRPFNVGAYDPAYWITCDTDCWDMAAEIDGSPHVPLLSRSQLGHLRKRDHVELEGAKVKQFPSLRS